MTKNLTCQKEAEAYTKTGPISSEGPPATTQLLLQVLQQIVPASSRAEKPQEVET